jgi:hypothetical protein
MENNLKVQKIATKKYVDSEENTIQIYKRNKNRISVDEVKRLVGNIQKERPNAKILIRGLGIDRWHTLKTFDEELSIMDTDTYYQGKVKEADKFADFSQLQLTVLKSKIV